MNRITHLIKLSKGDQITRSSNVNYGECSVAIANALCSGWKDHTGPARNIRDKGLQGSKSESGSIWNLGWPYHRKMEGYRAPVIMFSCPYSKIAKGSSQKKDVQTVYPPLGVFGRKGKRDIDEEFVEGNYPQNLLRLTKLIKDNPNRVFNDFTSFYADQSTLIFAYMSTKSKPVTAIDLKWFDSIEKSLHAGRYMFESIRRINIPKPGTS